MFFFELAALPLFWFGFLPIALLLGLWRIEAHGESGMVTFFALLLMTGLQLFTDIRPFSYVWDNPVKSLWIAAAYVAVGTGYVWIKWFSFVRTAARKLRDYCSKGYDTKHVSPSNIGYRGGSFPLQVSNYKFEIFGWMFYWPLSAAWTIFNDPIRRIFNAIYDRISGGLQRISDRAFNTPN